MKIIWEAMHQDDRRLLPCIFSDVNAMLISVHELFCEIHRYQPLRRLLHSFEMGAGEVEVVFAGRMNLAEVPRPDILT